MIQLIMKIYMEFLRNMYILSVYSPFSDRVGLPLDNIHNPVGKLIKSYFSNRTQRVQIDGFIRFC